MAGVFTTDSLQSPAGGVVSPDVLAGKVIGIYFRCALLLRQC